MREDLKQLLESAEEDFNSARVLFGMKYFRVSSFHSHQTVEKLLKCFLLYKKGSFPFIHSIRGLIQNCMNADEDFKYLFEINADKLDRYYTGTRYPPLLDVTEEEAREAVDIAEKVREFILKKLRL